MSFTSFSWPVLAMPTARRVKGIVQAKPYVAPCNLLVVALLFLLLSSAPAATVNLIQTAVDDSSGTTINVVSSNQWLETAVIQTTVTAPAITGSPALRFTHWTISSDPAATLCDAWGRSQNPASFVLLENSTATAHYLPATLDADADGVPDWFELEYYGTLANWANSDTDGDGLTLAQECTGGTNPLFGNTAHASGLSCADSTLVTCNIANYAGYAFTSDPAGTVNQSGFAAPGASISSPDLASNTSFAYWTLDGMRQQDVWGRALSVVTFTMGTTNRTCVATLLTGDSDGDGLPDAWEQFYFGTLANGATADPDGDGLTLAQEYAGDTNPLFANTTLVGGVAYADSSMVTVNVAGFFRYTLSSVPPGTVEQSAVAAPGVVITTPDLASNTSFAYWTLDGVRQEDAWGRALSVVTFTMGSVDRTCLATLLTGDSDGDGLPDAWEQAYFGTLAETANDDPDGDGLTLAQEYAGGTNPLFANTTLAGGVAFADSAMVTVHVANSFRYTLSSDPPGTVDQSDVVDLGTVIITPNMEQSTFGYWTLDAVVQRDAWGVAFRQCAFTLDSADRTAVAHLFTGDSDGDGIPDAWEMYYFGTLTNNATSDVDDDGLTLLQEYNNGLNPLFPNMNQPGGVFWLDSELVTVDLQPFDRPEYNLVGGVPTRFFTRWPTNNSGQVLGLNTHPALGDWNGDGTVDLFVGASNGVLRVFENTGSPVVPNLVERTTNFVAWAWAWSGITNPAPALGDWSGDGKADLAIGGDTGTIVLLASPGNFQGTPAPLTNTLALASTRNIPALANITGDGRADLFVLLDDGTVNLYANSGNALSPFSTAAVRTNLLNTVVPNATGLAVANADTNLEVLVSDSDGRIWEFQPDAALNFTLKSKVFGGSYNGFAHRLTIATADFDGDGDLDVMGGFAEGGLVYLQNPAPRLLISPPSATLAAGQQASFGTLYARGTLQWSVLRNVSGGSINASNGVYTAGATPGMDFLQAVDASGLRGRAYVNVIGTNDLASFGKAVVVAGGRDLNDPVWLASDYIANKAYNVLRYKGYARKNIQYLSFNPGRDIDGDGLKNDIAGFSSFTNVSATFTNWVGNANRLFVYLVDHGSTSPGDGYFRLNAGENLSSTQLNAWLTALQNQYQSEVVVVMDFCYAGRFLQDLAYAGPAKRVVIAATSPTELTYFLSGGFVSFSDLFLSGMMEGLDLQQAFLLAQDGMAAYQNATMDDNGDGIYQTNVDGTIAAQVQIGATHLAGKDVPVIGEVAASQTLSVGTTATLWADQIQSYYPIASVYCTILPPSFSVNTNAGVPVTGVSEVELAPDPSGRYQASFDGFTEAGAYRVNYYARDIWGSVSPPQQGLVIQAGFDERLVLVAGGTTSDPEWAATANMAATVYQTALARRLGKGRIQYLSAAASQDLDGDGTNDVAGASSLANLSQAITNWATGANKLTVYLLGSTTTTSGLFRLNATESLSAGQLDTWLDGFQSTNRMVIVVMDFDGSGSYLPALAVANGQERIVVASTTPGTKSLRSAGGLVSFSQFFLSGLFDGESLGAAFNAARDAIRNASSRVRQTPVLDDNGNGIGNQKNVDGVLAAQRYLGAAFVTGEDSPFIGEVVPPCTVVSGTPVLLWAMDILDVAGISNVWCVITPPDYEGQGDLPRTNLTWDEQTSRYEALYTNFTLPGTYVCTFFALDNLGLLSGPIQSEVTVTDAYEVDDNAAQATIFPVGDTEQHNFHSATDEDWVKFYAPTRFVFNIEATQLGTNSDLVLDLYYEQWDGTLTWVDGVDDYGPGADETESLVVDLKNPQSDLLPGVYYVRVSSADTNLFGPGSEYELRIYEPTGTGGGVITISTGGGSGTLAYIQVHITPQVAGAGWRLQGQTAYHTNPADTETISQGSSPAIEFRPVSGWDRPPGGSIEVPMGTLTVIPASYTRSAQLAVSPTGDMGFNGFEGGPFSPTNIICMLTNSGEGALQWAAIWTSNWVSLSASNGFLAGGTQTNISVSINPSANTLAGGSYTSTIGFLNQSNGLGNTTRRVSLSLLPPTAILGISPLTGLAASGYVGGPFSPSSASYSLTNSGAASLSWSASQSASWLSLSLSNGTLAAGATTNVTVSLNANANSLSPGSYSDTVGFTNLTTGLGNTNFPVTLNVAVHPLVKLLNPRVLGGGQIAMTLEGVTNGVYSILSSSNLVDRLTNWIEVLRLTNSTGQTVFTTPPPPSSPQYYRAKQL